jgi:mono/diheme cytochrome c family protein
MKKFYVLALLFIGVALDACKHEVVNPGGSTGAGGTGVTGPGSGSNVVCFETQILPIFQSSCAKSGCHNSISRQEGYVFETYAGIMRGIRPFQPNNSDIYEAITEDDVRKRMPLNSPALLPEQIALIKKWIEQGAQNTTNCGTVCDTTAFTFSGSIKNIFNINCVGCHTGPSGYNGIDLSTHTGAKAAAQSGKLMPAITHTGPFKMPKTTPDGQRKLDDCQIKQIQKWVNAGMPNN